MLMEIMCCDCLVPSVYKHAELSNDHTFYYSITRVGKHINMLENGGVGRVVSVISATSRLSMVAPTGTKESEHIISINIIRFLFFLFLKYNKL